MSATVAERSGSREQLGAGNGARRASAGRRRGPARGAGRPAQGGARSAPLRLVAAEGRLLGQAPAAPVRTRPATDAAAGTPAPGTAAAGTPAAAGARIAAGRTPVRLTRRGRLVVTVAVLLVVAAVSVILAGAAQALGHSGGPARLGPGITKVEVQPGQNLWSLAEAYDPNADTRQVIQEILQLNSMSTDQVQPGQVLWMPRD